MLIAVVALPCDEAEAPCHPTVGAYVDLAVDSVDPQRNDAVVLLFEGRKVGYVPKKDALPLLASLRLRREMYGVITAIVDREVLPRYEIEIWFSK